MAQVVNCFGGVYYKQVLSLIASLEGICKHFKHGTQYTACKSSTILGGRGNWYTDHDLL